MSGHEPGLREALTQFVDAARTLVGALTRLVPVQVTVRWRGRGNDPERTPAQPATARPGPPQHWLDFVARTSPEWSPGASPGDRNAATAPTVRPPEPGAHPTDTPPAAAEDAAPPATAAPPHRRPNPPGFGQPVARRPRLTAVPSPPARSDAPSTPAAGRTSAVLHAAPVTPGPSRSPVPEGAGDLPDAPTASTPLPPAAPAAPTRQGPVPVPPSARTVPAAARPATSPSQPAHRVPQAPSPLTLAPLAPPPRRPADVGTDHAGPVTAPRLTGDVLRPSHPRPSTPRPAPGGADTAAAGRWPTLPESAPATAEPPLVTRLWQHDGADDLVAAQRRS